MTTGSRPGGWSPGQMFAAQDKIEGLADRATARLVVTNTGDRPVQVGSHFHFFEVNRALEFDRERAYGMRLLVPAGTAVRFEPGQSQEVDLVALGGERVVHGLNALVNGALDDEGVRDTAFDAAPPLRASFHGMHPASVETADLDNNEGILATAMHCVNAIPYVVAAEPGIRTYLDLPLMPGRR